MAKDININTEDNNWRDKVKLFGTTSMPTKEPKKLDTKAIRELHEPLEGPKEGAGTVIKQFCRGCGYITEWFPEGLKGLALRNSFEVPESLQGLYVESNSCSLCNIPDMAAELKKIPDLP